MMSHVTIDPIYFNPSIRNTYAVNLGIGTKRGRIKQRSRNATEFNELAYPILNYLGQYMKACIAYL